MRVHTDNLRYASALELATGPTTVLIVSALPFGYTFLSGAIAGKCSNVSQTRSSLADVRQDAQSCWYVDARQLPGRLSVSPS